MKLRLHQLRMIALASLLGLSAGVAAQTASTQPANQSRSGSGEGRGNRGRNFTVAQMERIHEALEPTDDEWKVIEPRVEKIESLRRAIQNSRFGLRGRRGASAVPAVSVPSASPVTPGASAGGEQTELQTASQQLQEALNNKNTRPQDLKVRLAALREARARALADFTKAQDELREILTARQEAVLVTLGLLN